MRKYLDSSDWEQALLSDAFELIGEVNEAVLNRLEATKWILLKIKRTDTKIPYDGIKWTESRKQQGKMLARRQPYYRKMTVNGTVLYAVRCRSVHNDGLYKDIIHLDNFTYMHYFLMEGKFTMPPPEDAPKVRISKQQAKRVRKLLEEQPTRSVHCQAVLEGIPVNKRQCQNQTRNVPIVVRNQRRKTTDFKSFMREMRTKSISRKEEFEEPDDEENV